tara:strand:+ start:97 stop:324 length:228 start_codon:yes stop_codon:yes gene_type:complete
MSYSTEEIKRAYEEMRTEYNQLIDQGELEQAELLKADWLDWLENYRWMARLVNRLQSRDPVKLTSLANRYMGGSK